MGVCLPDEGASMLDSEYLRKKEKANHERHARDKQSYREQLVGALRVFYDHIKARDHKTDADGRRNRRIERLKFIRERRKFYIDLFAVGIAFIGAAILWKTLEEAHQGTIDANRAWISADGIDLTHTLEVGKRIEYQLIHNNVGKSPAIGIQYNIDNGYVRSPQNFNFSKMTFSRIDMCARKEGWVKQEAIFPGKGSGMRLASTSVRKGIVAIGDMKNNLFYSRGCISYETMGITGNTRFCFVLSPRWDEKTGKVVEFQSTNCANGNDAQ